MTAESSQQPFSSANRRVVAFAGGRGGIGRSVLAANVGVYLAQVGKQVVLIDADLGGASLHTILGLERPQSSLGQAIDRQADHLADLVIETPIPNLRLLPGAGDRFGVANLRPTQKERLLLQLRNIDADFVLLDVGAGTSFNVLDLYLVADYGVLVVVPEPTSVEAAYRFIKSAVIRLVRREVGRQTQWPQVLDETVTGLGGLPGPLELHETLKESAPILAELVETARQRLRPRLVVNRTRVRADLELGSNVRTLVANHLGVSLSYLGSIENDDAVWLAARKRRPLMIESSACQASKDIERIARRILAPVGHERIRAPSPPPRRVEVQNLYETLEIDIGASDEDIRRANKRMRAIYAADSLAGYSLVSRVTSEGMRRRVQHAFDTLLDSQTRRPYDLSLPQADPDGIVPIEVEIPISTEPTPPPVSASAKDFDISPETEFTGELLRHIRTTRGVELRDITTRTKIGTAYLKAIEDEDFDALPALVYTKGFVGEVAKFLDLDHRHVVTSYIKRFKKYLQESGEEE